MVASVHYLGWSDGLLQGLLLALPLSLSSSTGQRGRMRILPTMQRNYTLSTRRMKQRLSLKKLILHFDAGEDS